METIVNNGALIISALALFGSAVGWLATRRKHQAETVSEMLEAADRAIRLANEQAERSQQLANQHFKDLNTVRQRLRDLEAASHKCQEANNILLIQIEDATKRLSRLEAENERLRKRLKAIRDAIKASAPGVDTDKLFDSRPEMKAGKGDK